jgi:glyoxylase-like metal-dependent hydrolase (beta-lactamase superfamily II)
VSVHPPIPNGVRVFERGWLSSNNVLLVGRDRTALIDSGYATHSDQTLALVEQALDSRPLDVLVNTHLHSDHCGGNAVLQVRYPDVWTLIPPGEADAVQQWDEARLSYRATGQQCQRFEFDATLVPGEALELGDVLWQVHAAPGHDPHAVVLFDPNTRLLISGDALWEKGFGIVFPEMWGEPSFDQVAATLDLIESLQPACVVPGHGRVFEEVDTALAVARERLEAFVRSPEKHARHAIKVLIKFKLLELRHISCADLSAWLCTAGYFELVRRRFVPHKTLEDWSAELLDDLIRAGAARMEGDLIFDAP